GGLLARGTGSGSAGPLFQRMSTVVGGSSTAQRPSSQAARMRAGKSKTRRGSIGPPLRVPDDGRFVLQSGQQRRQIPGAIVACPVDEEAWRALDAAADAADEVVLHLRDMDPVREFAAEVFEVETERGGVSQ